MYERISEDTCFGGGLWSVFLMSGMCQHIDINGLTLTGAQQVFNVAGGMALSFNGVAMIHEVGEEGQICSLLYTGGILQLQMEDPLTARLS